MYQTSFHVDELMETDPSLTKTGTLTFIGSGEKFVF